MFSGSLLETGELLGMLRVLRWGRRRGEVAAGPCPSPPARNVRYTSISKTLQLHSPSKGATIAPMANARPGPKPVFTEAFLVQMRPEQRAALNDISETTGRTRSNIVREFIDAGVEKARKALEVIDASSLEEVVAALLSIGYQQSDIDQVLANQKEQVNGKAKPISQEHG